MISNYIARAALLPALMELVHTVAPELEAKDVRSVAYIPIREDGGDYLEVAYYTRNGGGSPPRINTVQVPVV